MTSTPRAMSAAQLRVVSADNLTPRDAGDTELLHAPLSLEEAYRRFAPYVAAIGMRILGRGDDLDDLVQDVFVEATRGIAGLSAPEAIKAWLARITVRTSVRRLRRARLFRAVHLQLEDAQDYESLASPDATPEQRALVARVYRTLDQLAANDRAAWVMRYVQGETLEQAAELCACSLSTYQRRLRRASELLDKSLPHE
jgi:RNA polymerase sigma-70 factor, ECF subfamily